MSTGIPYTHTSNPLCEQQIRVLKENVRIWCKTERTKDCVRLLLVISLMMNSQESSATGYTPHELFMGRPAWFLHAPYPEDSYSTVSKWVREQQDKVDKAKAVLQRVRKSPWNKKNKHRVPASYQEGDWVLVHHSRLPAPPLPDMNAEEMAKELFYLVKLVIRHGYRRVWCFLTLWEGFGVEEATWEPFSAFVLPEGRTPEFCSGRLLVPEQPRRVAEAC